MKAEVPYSLCCSKGLTGAVSVPGDKSLSHRALIFASLSFGVSLITGLLESDDVLATVRVLQSLGGSLTRHVDNARIQWHIEGIGIGGLLEPEDILDFGNSGTSARLIMGLLATHPVTATLTGDASLRQRPMERVLTPLSRFGAQCLARSGGRLPLTLRGTERAVPQSYTLPVPSAQVKSALLLAALNTQGCTEVREPILTRDHTERMLAAFGADISITPEKGGGRLIRLAGYPKLTGQNVYIPGDPSSAAFLVVAALITPESEIVLHDVLLNPTRTGFLTTLLDMGAGIEVFDQREEGGEQVGSLLACFSPLQGVSVPADRAPSMIDEYPVLAVAAAFARGKTRFEGVGELRVKESDRLSAIAQGLLANHVGVHEEDTALTIEGQNGCVQGGGFVKTGLDHRIAMSFLIMGCASRHPVSVDDISMIQTSFPSFLPLMGTLGAEVVRS